MTGWSHEPICSVGKVYTGSTPRTSEAHFYGGKIPFVTPAELDQSEPITRTPRTLSEAGARDAGSVAAGAVLVCCIGSLGKVGIAGTMLATNQQINSVEFDTRRVLPRFGFYACRLLKRKLEKMAPATTLPIVSKSKFEQLEILVPPLGEQRRIVDVLDRAEILRAKRRAALAKVDTLVEAIFLDLFGDPVINSKNFPIFRMGDICDVRDGTHDSPKYVSEGRYPLVTSKNLTSGIVDLTDVKYISQADYIQINKRSKVDRGDIIMPMIGTIGSPVLIDHEPQYAIKNVALIKFKGGSPSAVFVHHLLNSQYFDYIVGQKNRGGTQKFVSLGDLRSFPVPVPSLELQSQFGRRVAALEKLRSMQRTSRAQMDALFGSLQHRAFRGEL